MNSSNYLENKIACCDGFLNLLSVGENDGVSVVPVDDHGRKSFFFRACAVHPAKLNDPELENKLSQFMHSTFSVTNIKLEMFQYIGYCPFCGSNLSTLIELQADIFDQVSRNAAELF